MSDQLTPHEEHERRFLVDDLSVLDGASYFSEIEQAYLWADGGYAVRVRVIRPSDSSSRVEANAFLTLKGPRELPRDYMRYEVEHPIDLRHAEAIINLAPHVVTKRRYSIISEHQTYDIDVFTGRNEGLVIAEFEGSAQAVARARKPWFASKEVTQQRRYSNDELAMHPYRTWAAY